MKDRGNKIVVCERRITLSFCGNFKMGNEMDKVFGSFCETFTNNTNNFFDEKNLFQHEYTKTLLNI